MSSKAGNTAQIWQFTWSKWIVLITAFLVPLYANIGSWFPFVTPKVSLVVTGSLLAGVFFILGLIRQKDQHVELNIVHLATALFVLALAISAIFGADPNASFFGSFSFGSSIVLLASLFVLSFVISEISRREVSFIDSLIRCVFVGGVVLAVTSYFPLLGIGQGSQLFKLAGESGMIGNSSFTGAYLVFVVGAGVFTFMTALSGEKKKKILTFLGLAVVLFCPVLFNSNIWKGGVSIGSAIHSPMLFLGQAEGAVLGILIGAILVFFIWLTRLNRNVWRWIGVALIVCLAVGTTFVYAKLLQNGSDINTVFVERKTANRLFYWTVADQAFIERPLLGHGFGNFERVFESRNNPGIFLDTSGGEEVVSHPHNIVYDLVATSGILGLLLYLVLLGTMIYGFTTVREVGGRKLPLYIFSGVILAYFIQNLFIFDMPVSWLELFIVIGLAMSVVASSEGEHKLVVFPARTDLRRGMLYLKAGAFIVAIYLFAILPAKEARVWNSLRTDYVGIDNIEIQNRTSKISLIGTPDDVMLYGYDLVGSAARAEKDLTTQEKDIVIRKFDSVIAILDEQTSSREDNFSPQYLLMGTMLHMEIMLNPDARVESSLRASGYFSKAREISPNNPKVYYNLAQNAIFRNDAHLAVAYTRAAIAMSPKSVEGYNIAKVILKNISNKELSDYATQMKKTWRGETF